MNPIVLREVRVDRLNEKGVFIAEQILNILHSTAEGEKKSFFHSKKAAVIPYTFEVANVRSIIRFFFGAPESHITLLENQIYAHFPNVEISEVSDYLPTEKPFITEIGLLNSYIDPLKIYTEFKDRSEKESVDPLSSITGALSQTGKGDTTVLQVNFRPILDKEWKSSHTVEILKSKRPKWLKKFLLSPL